MQSRDLGRMVTVGDARLHPDGRRVAFVVSRPDPETDRYERSVWLFDGEESRPFTRGPADTRPRWSPDGSCLAFLRATGEQGEPAQVAVIPAGGGEARILTDFDLGATEAEWSPSGALLAVVGARWADEWVDLAEEERARVPRRIAAFGYRFDDLGWRHDRTAHVYLVDPAEPAGTEPVPLTAGPFHDADIAWRPDGEAVAFLSARHENRYLDSGTQVWEVPVSGGEAVPLVDVGYWIHVSYRSDGEIFLGGLPDVWAYPDLAGLWHLRDGALRRTDAGLDRSMFPPAPPVAPAGPQWLDDGGFLAVVEDAGRMGVVRWGADGSTTGVVGGDRLVTGISPRPDGSAFVFTATDPTDPGELWWWEDGEERRLTDLNGVFRAEVGLVEPEHFRFENDGVEIDAWVVLPAGEGPVPALLNIHGGPATQYGFGFFDEFQVYAGAGFGVVACNPRGSSGRGRDFMRAPVGRWTEERPPDLEDVLAALDAALQRFGRLDPRRVGVMGGSYGGFLTVRILAVDDRFLSAVPERGVYAFTSFSGTSDIGPRFTRHYLGDLEPGDIEARWAASPLATAHRVRTPCLIVHSESDYRCPIEQAEQLFAVLLQQGVDVEMLRFPGSSHELSRSGRPRYRRERMEAIVDWHRRHLGHGTHAEEQDSPGEARV